MIKKVKFYSYDTETKETGVYTGYFANTAEVVQFIRENRNPNKEYNMPEIYMVPMGFQWIDAQAFDFDRWEEL